MVLRERGPVTTRSCPLRVELTVTPVLVSSRRSPHTASPQGSTPSRLAVRMLTVAPRSSSRNMSTSVKSETGASPSTNRTLDVDGNRTMGLSLTSSTSTSNTVEDDKEGEPRSRAVTTN